MTFAHIFSVAYLPTYSNHAKLFSFDRVSSIDTFYRA